MSDLTRFGYDSASARLSELMGRQQSLATVPDIHSDALSAVQRDIELMTRGSRYYCDLFENVTSKVTAAVEDFNVCQHEVLSHAQELTASARSVLSGGFSADLQQLASNLSMVFSDQALSSAESVVQRLDLDLTGLRDRSKHWSMEWGASFQVERELRRFLEQQLKLPQIDFQDDRFLVAGEAVFPHDVQEVLEGLVQGHADVLTLVENVLEEQREHAEASSKESRYARLIAVLSLLLTILTYLGISPDFDEHRRAPQQKIKMIQKALQSEYHREEIGPGSQYITRLVTTDRLVLYAKKTRKSRPLGELRLGDHVILLQKRRNWSEVVFADPYSSIVLRGWVFTRYLKKIEADCPPTRELEHLVMPSH